MNYEFLEEQIIKAKDNLAFHTRELENEQQKVRELSNATLTNPDILKVLEQAKEMERWFTKSCKEDLMLLDVFYTARDCTNK